MTTETRGEVLVVGAGPTGLTMALELAGRGVEVRVVDQSPVPDPRTRALGMQARTLELFERHGIVGELLARGLRTNRFRVFSEGHQVLDADFGQLAGETAYPFLLMIPQQRTEEILAARLAAYGVTVERGVTMTGFAQDDDGVDVDLSHADGTTEQARASWLVGADGARSAVRRGLGLDFVGTSFEENFTVADLRIVWPRPHDEFFAFLQRGRFMGFFPMLGGWHRVAIARPADDPRDGEVTQEELQDAVDATVPGSARIAEVRQAGRFRINQRRAAAHAVGRVYLAGDAAHIHSVIGAQGMNTGIQDAFNLGWKLAAVLRGEADPSLLKTYGAERVPVAERLVRGTRTVTTAALMGDPVRTGLRRRIAPWVLARPQVRHRLIRAIAQLDVSYAGSSGAAPSERAEVGDRAPDAVLEQGAGARIFDLLDPTAYTLLCFDVPPTLADDVASTNDGWVHVVQVRNEPDAAARYGLSGPGAVLVRPDGYIAQRTTRPAFPRLPDRVGLAAGRRS